MLSKKPKKKLDKKFSWQEKMYSDGASPKNPYASKIKPKSKTKTKK